MKLRSGRPYRFLALAFRVLRSPWTIQFLATAPFIAFIVWRVDLTEGVRALLDGHYGWALLALAIYFATRVVDTVRWRLYLAKVGKVPLLPLLGSFLIGNFGNNVLPFRAGDVVKIQLIANRYGLSRAGMASTVFVVEGVLDGVTFLLLLLIGLALLDLSWVPAPLFWSLAASAGLGFLATVAASRYLPRTPPTRLLRLLPERLRSAFSDAWPRFLDGMETMRSPRMLGAATVLNFASWSLQVFMFWTFALAFGLDLPFVSYVVVMIAANLVAVTAITFQNIGTYEVVVLEIMVAMGIVREEGFAYAVSTHLITNLWVVILGIAALLLMRVRPRDILTVKPAEEEPATVTPAGPSRLVR